MEGTEGRPGESREGMHGVVRVLVIDDDADIRRLLCDILTSAGHLVADASNGAEGIEIFKKEAFDLVLTDLEMPEMSGWEVARSIKNHNPDVTIALITGWGETINSTRLRESGISTIVNKPFRMDQIINLARAVQAGTLSGQR
jgi:DNA-binding response OmpR family regulator